MSEVQYVTREEYNKDIKRLDIKISEQGTHITTLFNDTSSLKAIWQIVGQLPDETKKMREEQIKISVNFQQMFEKLEEIKATIDLDKKDTNERIQKLEAQLNRKITEVKGELEQKIEQNVQNTKANDEKIQKVKGKFKLDWGDLIQKNLVSLLILIGGVVYIIQQNLGG